MSDKHHEFDRAIDELLDILARQIAQKHLREAPRDESSDRSEAPNTSEKDGDQKSGKS